MILSKNKKLITLMATLLLAVLPLDAQIVYSCDFEDPTECSQWTLNVGAKASLIANHWYIGEPGDFSQYGSHGLYVSSLPDSSAAVYESASASSIIALRTMTLTPGSYFLDFDWRALGKGSNAQLVVFWMPQGTGRVYASNNGQYSNTLDAYKLGAFYGSKAWQPAHLPLTVTAADSQGQLVFIWTCAADDPKDPSGCVDNITIRVQGACAAPSNLTYNTATATLKWSGTASYYQVRDYCANDGSILEYDSITAKQITLNLSSEGTHEFFVRAMCDSVNYSQWVSTSTFVWIPGLRCIDYLDIGANLTHAGVCYVGNFDDFITSGRKGTLQMVDLGPSDDHSLHTMHTDVNEIDPNTTAGGGLSTVPDGEIASIRLGGRDYPGPEDRSARIEYKYKVQPGMSDLLDLKYAVVLQSGGHDENIQPSFKLEVLDGSGHLLASSCTRADFKPGFGATNNWHIEDDIYWSDWATVTISLVEYPGQTLTIRLTTTRCTYDTHFAYAYFTLGCRSGDLEGLACGDFATDHFDAPEGFNYRWYRKTDPTMTTLSTERTLHIESTDSSFYIVECHDPNDYTCYFTIEANPNPRYPIARIDTVTSISDCRNTVTFNNTSVVRVVNRSDGQTMAEEDPIYDILYDYGDGYKEMHTGTSHSHIYPATGGTFHCAAIASMNDGMCEDTIFFDITLPDILHTGSDKVFHRCEGDYFVMPAGDTIYRDTVITTYSTNQYGCQAPSRYAVYFHPTSYDSTVVELCEGGAWEFQGQRYDQTGNYTVNLKTVHGCDSVLELKLTIVPRLVFSVPDTIEICSGDSVLAFDYQIFAGRGGEALVEVDSVAFRRGFDPLYSFPKDSTIVIPLPKNLRVGYYRLLVSVGTPDCPAEPLPVILKVKYSSEVIDQKNDIVALLNEDYNGGYRWVGYQWYRDDQPIYGATTSYVVVSDNDQNSRYYCVLISEDGLEMPTCEVVYTSGWVPVENVEVLHVSPTVLMPGEAVTLSHGGDICVYDALGRLVYSAQTSEALPARVEMPAHSGVYLLTVAHEAVRVLVK